MNRRGVTLPEVTVSMAILLGAALTIGLVSQITTSMTNHRRIYNSYQKVTASIRDQLRHSADCQNSLVGDLTSPLNSYDSTVDTIDDLTLSIPGLRTSGGDLVRATPPDNNLPDQEIKIDKLRLVNIRPQGLPDSDGNQDYVGVLRMIASTTKTNYLHAKTFKEEPIGSILFRVNSADQIISCGGTPTQGAKDFCLALDCTWDPAANPKCDCPKSIFGCPPGHVLMGITNFEKNCVHIGGKCPNENQFVRGVTLGGVICEDAPHCQAGAGAITWYGPEGTAEENNFCMNNDPIDLAPGQSATILSVSPAAGSATIACDGGIFTSPVPTSCGSSVAVATPTPMVCPTGFSHITPSPYGGAHACVIAVPNLPIQLPNTVSASVSIGPITTISISWSGASPYYCPAGFSPTGPSSCQASFPMPAGVLAASPAPYSFVGTDGTIGVQWNYPAYPSAMPNPCPPYMRRAANSGPTNGFCLTTLTSLWQSSLVSSNLIRYTVNNDSDPGVSGGACPAGLIKSTSSSDSGGYSCRYTVTNPYPNPFGADAPVTLINNFSRYDRDIIPYGTAVVGFTF